MIPDLPLPRSTYEARLRILRALLRDQDLDGAMILSPALQYWLVGYDTFLGAQIPQAVILSPKEEEPPVQVVWDADIAIAHNTSLVRDIRSFRFGVDEPADLFVEVLLQMAPTASRIGIDASSLALTYAFGKTLEAAFAPATLIDITQTMDELQRVKTPEELNLMRRAGVHARAGLAAAISQAKAGITEQALAGEIEYAMRQSGSDYWSIPTEMTSGPRSLLGHGTPNDRVLEPGDLLQVEIGGVERRYNCVGMQTFALPGAPPQAAARELYQVALECLRAGLRALRPGIPACDVEAPALEVLHREGLGDNFKMRFGYGIGIGYPPSWFDGLKITRTSNDPLLPGSTFVLHTCLLDDAESLGVVVGGSYAMLEEGYELLSGAGDSELHCED